MRPTISSLQEEIRNLRDSYEELLSRNSDLDTNLRMERAEVERLVTLTRDTAVTMDQMRREAALRAEILLLTQALLSVVRTNSLSAKAPDADEMLMADGKPVSRKLVERAAAQSVGMGSSSGGFIPAIKNVREQTGCGLREAKYFCDQHFLHLKA